MTAPQPRQKYKKIRLYPIPARGNGKSTVKEGKLKWVH